MAPIRSMRCERSRYPLKTTVLMLGSGPSATEAHMWSADCWTHLVVINNAWRVRGDWDMCIFPEDLPVEKRPASLLPDQHLIEARDFVPMQNQFGGVVYAGGTMAFTAAYWALGALKPDVMAFFGCDLVYPASGPTHFMVKGLPIHCATMSRFNPLKPSRHAYSSSLPPRDVHVSTSQMGRVVWCFHARSCPRSQRRIR